MSGQAPGSRDGGLLAGGVVAGMVAGISLGAFVAGDLNPAWLSASGALTTATAAVVAGVLGIRTYQRSREDRRAASRPMVIVELQQVRHSKGYQRVVLRNDGPSIARDIDVRFDPEIPDPGDGAQSVTPFLKRRYARTIAMLTPGAQLENLYYVAVSGAGGEFVNGEPTPDQVTVTVTYRADDGTEYEDEFPLDTDLLRMDTYTTSSTSPDEQQKKHVKAAENTAAAVKALNHTLRESTRGESRPAEFDPETLAMAKQLLPDDNEA